jgi:PhzF family phenazine biosynthesis protein
MRRRFLQVDVFGAAPYLGNPVAVVLDGDGLTDQQMQSVARWTNLSETTFGTAPTAAGADYRVRIFTVSAELPFAGHPTLGTCHAWMSANNAGASSDLVVQECRAGLIRIRTGQHLAFAAPPLLRSGPVEEGEIQHLAETLAIDRSDIQAAEWVDNGPGWVALLLPDADAVLRIRPGRVDGHIGVVGAHPAGSPEAFEVRAFVAGRSGTIEDPVTGSLNASLAQWLFSTGRAQGGYVARQGTAIGRQGRVNLAEEADGTVWVGGATVTCVEGVIDL